GTIVHWPRGFAARGELRSQFCHVIDVAPTMLEAAGLPKPVSVKGIQQQPLHGVSMAYAFADPGAAGRHETQYFEMFGNRGIYHQGWTAVTKHKTPWILVGETVPAFDDVWELYDTNTDWSQSRDLAKEQPEKLHQLQRLWLVEASRNGVLPLDDRVGERLNPDLAGRPTLIKGTSQVLFGGMGRLSESSVVSIKNKSHAVTAEVVVPASGAEGVIIAQGGSIGGWSLYAKGGTPKYCYNLLGIQRFYVEGERALPEGTHQVRMEFAYDGGGLGKGGTATLYLDGEQIGSGRVDATAAMIFSADDTCDVGVEGGAVVTDDYGTHGNAFSGEVNWVQIDLAAAAEDADHLITPEERLRVAMARQ
ncbi:MAG TPA: arylsulfatase, partial [Chloroflexota bacterium]|nr:arylsulfatase [Chloroflexota bacterium]